jgi:hypothetical protein
MFQVVGQRHLPLHGAGGYGMYEAKLGGVQGQARRGAWTWRLADLLKENYLS